MEIGNPLDWVEDPLDWVEDPMHWVEDPMHWVEDPMHWVSDTAHGDDASPWRRHALVGRVACRRSCGRERGRVPP